MLTAIAVALVTDWLYVDVAGYLAERSPTCALVALVVKTVVVFSALFFFLWQVKPSEWQRPTSPKRLRKATVWRQPPNSARLPKKKP